MDARVWTIAVTLLVAGGCQAAVCSDALFVANGRCVDPKAACGVECGEHELCDITVVPNTCHCAVGYEGDPCTWSGSVVSDPSFQDSEAWIDEGGQVIEAALGSSGGDAGEGVLHPSAVCSGGRLTQIIEMPPYDAAEPLVAEVVYQASLVHGLAIGFGDAWTRLPPTGEDYRTEIFCLGEAAYWRPDPGDPITLPAPLGGPVTLRVSASERATNCNLNPSMATIRVDRLLIRPPRSEDDEYCPVPARPPNGSGTIDGDAGWRFECTDGGTPAPCSPGLAATGSFDVDSAKLSRDEGADDPARMTIQVSVPLPTDTVRPALAFSWDGSNERMFPVEIGTFGGFDSEGQPDRARALETLVGAGGGRDYTYCLPPWTHGAVVDLSFALPDDGRSDAVALIVDEVRVVSDDRCDDVNGMLDRGFESAPNRWIGTALSSSDQRASMKPEAASARTGNGVLELSYGWASSSASQSARLSMETYVLVPETDGTGGPAVALHTDSLVQSSATVEWLLGRDELCRGSLPDGEWSRTEICLPADWSGRWVRLKVRVRPPDEPGTGEERFRVLVDDLELLTSADCPDACP